ncbi:MAG: lipopolysaccharide heptosyltransferase II [Deltaproteobacteria bacterium]|nr:lipopolysaccharide heptosyltransferase II [Deltaproteobacteria bacterium]MBW2118078.1 lipopolysaccharide heptosyltransferase II [Deltaproteobacteria bacterium]MBW2343444.1 lipopolysaccharide heptosyltransferase II [Deltaproteobacteria bacterium]
MGLREVSELKVIGNKKIDKSKVSRIMVRATNWVGDAIMTLPALEALRENFPDSSITVLGKPWMLPLLENHPAVDRVITLRKEGRYLADLVEVIRVIREIRKQKFDLAVLFQNAFEAAFLAYLGGAEFRLGYNTDGRGFLLSHGIIRNDEILKVHQVEYYLIILRAMSWNAASRDPSLYVDKKYIEDARRLMDSNGIKKDDFLIGLSPGAIFGEAKRWPSKRFARIGDWAVERWGARVVVMGSEKEMDICRGLSDFMANRPINLCGRTSLGEAMGVISQCRFFVTNDSGLMHMAAALNVPTVAVFGSTDPVATGPRGPNTRIVKHDIECAPCLKPTCPEDFRCMLSIEPEEVWDEMEDLREDVG